MKKVAYKRPKETGITISFKFPKEEILKRISEEMDEEESMKESVKKDKETPNKKRKGE